ncbi:hypothetical protein C8R45DRAFT_329335 [Mycena sanguinolenta]|nr:hypothetical protein C8R45DRAFT_329335 [Mycena sanguinolenta]
MRPNMRNVCSSQATVSGIFPEKNPAFDFFHRLRSTHASKAAETFPRPSLPFGDSQDAPSRLALQVSQSSSISQLVGIANAEVETPLRPVREAVASIQSKLSVPSASSFAPQPESCSATDAWRVACLPCPLPTSMSPSTQTAAAADVRGMAGVPPRLLPPCRRLFVSLSLIQLFALPTDLSHHLKLPHTAFLSPPLRVNSALRQANTYHSCALFNLDYTYPLQGRWSCEASPYATLALTSLSTTTLYTAVVYFYYYCSTSLQITHCISSAHNYYTM